MHTYIHINVHIHIHTYTYTYTYIYIYIYTYILLAQVKKTAHIYHLYVPFKSQMINNCPLLFITSYLSLCLSLLGVQRGLIKLVLFLISINIAYSFGLLLWLIVIALSVSLWVNILYIITKNKLLWDLLGTNIFRTK